MGFLFELIGELLGSAVLEKISNAQDRRLITEGRVRCVIAATQGRVLNIGTEWSGGRCDLSHQKIHFVPTMGIVGDRDIPVDALVPTEPPPQEFRPEFENAAWYRVTVGGGELIWGIPSSTVDEVHQLLGLEPVAPPTEDH